MSMRNNLPKLYRAAQMIIDMDVAGTPGEIDPSELPAQMFLKSMTWQLAKEEWIAGLAAGTDDQETRKDKLRAKWRSQFAKGDLESLQAVANAYRNGDIDISYAYPVITIRFVNGTGVPYDIRRLKDELRKIAPAHLRLDYIFIYQKHEDLRAYTHQTLHSYTHEGIRNGDV